MAGAARFSPYFNGMLYCGFCGRWWRREEAVRSRRGALLCPRCRQQLRARPLRLSKTGVWRAYLEMVRVRVHG